MQLKILQCRYCPLKADCAYKKKLQKAFRSLLPGEAVHVTCKKIETLFYEGQQVRFRGWAIAGQGYGFTKWVKTEEYMTGSIVRYMNKEKSSKSGIGPYFLIRLDKPIGKKLFVKKRPHHIELMHPEFERQMQNMMRLSNALEIVIGSKS